ncbi:MAG: dUTP diphosphatase [Hyphomonadaceae bacterium]|nr:dUTP diphosphatase [Clostridia bacterium]
MRRLSSTTSCNKPVSRILHGDIILREWNNLNALAVKIKYLSPHVKPPQYATQGSAGVDLTACIDTPITLNPQQKVIIPTGIAIGLPSNETVGLVFARSGLGIKHGITMSNGVGVIDSDYTGEICCGLINLGDQPYTITPNDRIAQLLIMPVYVANFVQVEQLDETERGTGGFGSTGKN